MHGLYSPRPTVESWNLYQTPIYTGGGTIAQHQRQKSTLHENDEEGQDHHGLNLESWSRLSRLDSI